MEAATLLGDVHHPDEGDDGHADGPEHRGHVGEVEVHEHGQVLPVGPQQRPVELLNILQCSAGRLAL